MTNTHPHAAHGGNPHIRQRPPVAHTRTHAAGTGAAKTSSGKPKSSGGGGKSRSSKQSANLVPGYIFGACLVIWSIAINVTNLFQAFAPAARSRFIASGVTRFLQALPLFGFINFCFYVAVGSAIIGLVIGMRRGGFTRNYIWIGLLAVCSYMAAVGLIQTILSYAFVFAAMVVIGLQYLEILYWSSSKKTLSLHLIVAAAYAVEIWLQYEMMPVHTDYATVPGLLMAMGTLNSGFNWAGFQPIQMLLGAVGIVGVELSERCLKIVERFG